MTDFSVDLTNCDREPIHIPGQIQSHGFLVAIDEDLIIRFHSDNIDFLTGENNTLLLGKPLKTLESYIGESHPKDFIGRFITLGKLAKSFDQVNPITLKIGGQTFYLIISLSDGYYLLEFERVLSDIGLDVQKIGRSISEMLADKNLNTLLENTASQVKKVISYDRVMIYRFAEDGHGEVVAEAKNDDLDPWLGLHYPASDIPRQARELYKRNLTRLIADVETKTAKIFTAFNNITPLDLTNSQLRAVSPIHIQYLKNMGVASSFSISLIYKGELWGLIACHNYTPRFIDYKSRESSKLMGQILSSALEFRQDEETQKHRESFDRNLDQINKYLQSELTVEEALTKHKITILDLVQASGAVLTYEGKRITLGETPDNSQISRMLQWIDEDLTDPVFYTDFLTYVYPQARFYAKIASGILVVTLSKELKEYLIWFKPEQIQTIKWAGDPNKPVNIDLDSMMKISPRNSFEVWAEDVSGHSATWTAEEISSASRLKDAIAYSVNLKTQALRALNEGLRQAYEELDTFSYTISHDLKNPLAVIKSYAQVLSVNPSLDNRALLHAERINEQANKMNKMIKEVLEYSRVGRQAVDYKKVAMKGLVEDIIKEIELIYGTTNLKITCGNLLDIQGDPTMIYQVFANLISNAVKYSQSSVPSLVQIMAEETGTEILYTIIDNGMGIDEADLESIFELFNRLETVKDIEGSGVGLSIVKRIVEKHNGRIWAEGKPGIGSTFTVAFKKPAQSRY